jgi:hypothetical protein
MKVRFLIKHYPKKNLKELLSNQELLEQHNQDIKNFMQLSEANGLDSSVVDTSYLSEEFFKVLELATTKFRLAFDFQILYTKKELERFKIFILDSISSIAIKNDITYSKKYDPDNICSILGKIKWQENTLKIISQSHIAVDKTLKNKIEDSILSGYDFTHIYNASMNIFEDAYCLKAKQVLKSKRVIDKLTFNLNDKNNIRTHGYIILEKDSLSNLDDFMYCKDADNIVVSQNTRKFFMDNKTKRTYFEPIFEYNTELYEGYNDLIKDFAKVVMRYNSEHIVGFEGEKIKISKLLDGIV